MGVALQNHTPIERPAQGLSFGAGLDSLRPQLWIPEPLARPTGWTCWISLCLAGLVLRSQNSRTVGSRPTNPYTHRKACSRPFVWCRGPLCRRSGFECRPVRAPNRFDLKFERVTKSDRYGPVTRDPLGVALHNHTPIERPAQGLSFDARVDSICVQLLNVDPLARPAGLTCWISLCLAG